MLNPKDQPWLRPAIASLTGGIDEIVFIFFYLLLIDRVLKGLWTLGHILPWSPGGAKVTKEERSESNYDRSLLGYLRAPARTLGWSMLSIWFVDAVVIIMTAMGPPMTKQMAKQQKLVPLAVSIVLYSNVAGRVLAAVKNWWIEQALSKALKPPPSRAQQAFARRSSGILLWSAVFLVSAEGLSKATGLSLNSVFSFAGVGGIAVGLATKDLLTNVRSSRRPFVAYAAATLCVAAATASLWFSQPSLS